MAIKIYYTPTSCGAASVISATLGGVEFEKYEVDLATHTLKSDGSDFYKVNPKGNVPTIVLEDGTKLVENTACLAFLASVAKKSIGGASGPELFDLLNALGFVSSELHQAFGPLFNPSLEDTIKEIYKKNATTKAQKLVDQFLDGGSKTYLRGDALSCADIYAAVVLSWAAYLGVDLPESAATYRDAIFALSEVVEAKKAL